MLSDYGFKITFGNEHHTNFLKKALQVLIDSEVPIKKVAFIKNEVSGITKDSRGGLFDLTCEDENGRILHIEIQSSNDSTMLHRMRLYHALFTLKYKYPIKQFVIYVGDDKLTMESELKEEEIYKGYELKDVRSYSSEGLTKSDIPEEIIMAVLGDFGNEPAEKVIGLIIERLRVVSQDEGKLGKYVYQLTTLSKLRKLEEITIKKVKDMALTIDLTDSVLYKEGEKAGENKTKRKMVLNLLKKGTFSIESIAELAEVSVEFVKSAQAEESKK